MMTDDQISKVAALGAQMANVIEALAEIKTMMLGFRAEFVRREHHDFQVSALEQRVAALERGCEEECKRKDDERKNSGMLAWWVNVTKVFAGIAVIASVIGVFVTLSLSWARR